MASHWFSLHFKNYKWGRTFLMNCLFLFLPNFLLGCLFFFLTPHWFAVALCYWRKLTFCPFCLSIFSHLSFFFWFCWCSVFWSLEAYNFWVLFSQTHQWGGCLILIRALMFDTNTMLYNISRVTWFEPGVCFWRIPFWPRFVLIGWSYCLFRIYN